MKNVDKEIRDALPQEDGELLEPYRAEPSLCETVLETFRRRWPWLVAIAMFKIW